MKRRKGSIGSATARVTRRSKRLAEKIDDKSESQQLGVSFDDIPSHITAHILGRLPVKSVFICKSVCRRWKAVISDPHFAKLHFQHAPAGLMIWARDTKLSRIMYLLERESEKFKNDDNDGQFCCCKDSYVKPECNSHFKLDHQLKLPLFLDKRDDKFVVVNSCNGLLCLSDWDKNYFVVCNPVTGEFIRLPEPTRIHQPDYNMYPELDVGLGFQPKTNEYKVVRMFKRRRTLQDIEAILGVEIHTLGTSTWRNVEIDPMHVCSLGLPTCVSGALYWICYYHNERSILCFEFESESFQFLPSPPHLYIDDMTIMGEYEGSLYICNSSSMSHFKMWIMKKNGFEESWSLVFSSDIMSRPNGGFYWPVKQFQKGAALLTHHSWNCFIYYEPERYEFNFFEVHGTQSTFQAIPHIPSLISLKDAVKGDNIDVVNVRSRYEALKLQEEKEVPFLAKVNELTNLCCVSSDDEE